MVKWIKAWLTAINLPLMRVLFFGNAIPLSSSSELQSMEPYILLSLLSPRRDRVLSVKLLEAGQVLMVEMLSDADQASK